jgi:hypothetical protein
MSELNTVISKIAKKYPSKGYEKKGITIYNAYRDSVMNGDIPVFAFTAAGKPESTAKLLGSITGYSAAECLTFMSELFNYTKNGVISSKLLNPKLDVQQSVSKKEFEKLKPGIISVPDVSSNIKKLTLPIVIPAVIIIGLIVANNAMKLTKTFKKTL